MALRLHCETRRFLSLGAGVLLCASVGCTTTKDDQKPITNQVSKTTMGPGNSTMSPAEPISPAYANLAANQVVRTQSTAPALYNPVPTMPSMPSMPTSPNPNPNFLTTLGTPTVPNGPASFGSIPASPVQTAGYGAVPPTYPPIQPMGGTQMTVPTMMSQPTSQPQPQQQFAQQTSTQFQQLPPSSNQMPNVQMPAFAPASPAGTQQTVPYMSAAPQQGQPQFNTNPQPQPSVPATPLAFQPIPTAAQTQLSSAPQFVAPQPVQPALPVFQSSAPAFGAPLVPSNSSAVNQPTSMTMPSTNTPTAKLNANMSALDSGSMAPSAKSVANSLGGVSDPRYNLPSEPVIEAPLTVPSAPQ